MIVNKFEIWHPFVKSNLVIPFEAHIYGTCTGLWHSLNRLIKLTIEESGLISKMATKTKKHKFVIFVLLFVNSEHDSVGVAQLTVRIHCVENTCKGFGKVAEVKSEP